jgi:hypothetical protein
MGSNIPQGWVPTEAPDQPVVPSGWVPTDAPAIDPNRLGVQNWAGNPVQEQEALGYEGARGASLGLVDLVAPQSVQQDVNQYSAEHPVAAVTARTAGSLVPGLLAPELLPGFGAEATTATRALANAGLGSGEGAVAGATSNERSPITGAEKGALIGGAGGLVLGGMAGNILGPVRKVVGGDNYVGNQTAALISSKLAKDAEYGSPGALAIADSLDRAASLGVPAGIVDLGGESTAGFAGDLYRSPGAPRAALGNYFTSRDADATGRLLDAIDGSVRTGGKTADEAIQDQLQARSQAAAPLYDALYQRYPVVSSDRINQFVADPLIQQGLGAGIKLQRLEALAEGRPFDPQAYTVDFNAAGDPVSKGTPNLRTLDAAKRGLDDLLSGDTYRNQYGQLTQMGNAINGVRKAYVNELDSLTGGPDGAYAQARAAWAGPSRAMELVNEGGRWMNKAPTALARETADLTPSEKDFYLLGVASNMRDRVLTQTGEGNEANRILNSPMAQQRAQALFDPDAYQALVNRVEGERQAFKSYAGVTRGPRPSGASAAGDHLGEVAAPVVLEMASQHPGIGIPYAVARYGKKLYDWANAPSPAVKAEAARVYTMPPEDQASYLRGIVGRPMPRPVLAPSLTPGIAGVFNTAPGEFFRQPAQARGGIVGYDR